LEACAPAAPLFAVAPAIQVVLPALDLLPRCSVCAPASPLTPHTGQHL